MAQLAMKANALYVLLKIYTVEILLITLITQHLTERSPGSSDFGNFWGISLWSNFHLAQNFLMLSFYVHPGQFALVEMNCRLRGQALQKEHVGQRKQAEQGHQPWLGGRAL